MPTLAQLTAALNTGIRNKTAAGSLTPANVADAVQAGYDNAAAMASGTFRVSNYGAVGNGIVNDTAAIQAAINAAAVNGGRVLFDPLTYLVSGPVNASSRGVLTIPQQTQGGNLKPITLEGAFHPGWIGYDGPAQNAGTILVSNTPGTASHDALLSCAVPGGSANLNYASVRLKDIVFRVTDNPSLSCVNAYSVACCSVESCIFDTGIGQFQLAEPTVATQFGFKAPQVGNYGLSTLQDCVIGGMFTAVIASEHLMLRNTCMVRNKVALEINAGNFHFLKGDLNVFHCPTTIKVVGDGGVSRPAAIILDLDIERDGSAGVWWRFVPGQEIRDDNHSLKGTIGYKLTVAGTGDTIDPITFTGCSGVKFTNLLNPFQAQPTPTVPPAATTIANFTPATAAPGATVAVTGTGFAGATAVTINSGPNIAPASVSATQVTFVVPAGAGNGLIRVTSPQGTAVSATALTVTGATATGTALRLSGGGAVTNTPSANLLLAGSSNFEVRFGMAMAAGCPNGTQPWSIVDPAADDRLTVVWDTADGHLNLYLSTTTGTITLPMPAVGLAGGMHDYRVVYNGSVLDFWINGVVAYTSTRAIVLNTLPNHKLFLANRTFAPVALLDMNYFTVLNNGVISCDFQFNGTANDSGPAANVLTLSGATSFV